MDRRRFIQSASAAALLSAATTGATLAGTDSKTDTETQNLPNEDTKMKIAIAADPFALQLKAEVKKHLEELGHGVIDVDGGKEVPYYDGASQVAGLVQQGNAERGILFCGTGMGMSIVANKFAGVTASCVESIFAARMCRAINDANVLTMGAMVMAPWSANLAVDAFLETKHTESLEQFSDFLKAAVKTVDDIDQANRRPQQ